MKVRFCFVVGIITGLLILLMACGQEDPVTSPEEQGYLEVGQELLQKPEEQEQYVFSTKWGIEGSGDGQFKSLEGIAVDSSGNVYVTDAGNRCIQKFTSGGVFLKKWKTFKWGTFVQLDKELVNPGGIAADSSGNVYVCDREDRIQKFTSDGVSLTNWRILVNSDKEFMFVGYVGVAVDSSGNVYVAGWENRRVRIQKFTSDGIFLTKWETDGGGKVHLDHFCGIAVDSSGNVYVADAFNHCIQKFTSDGIFLTKWGTDGSGDGQFTRPQHVVVDSSGNIYVTDAFNSRIQKFTSDGIFLTKWGTYGSGDGQFVYPQGVAVDSSGNVYLADCGNYRIQKFSPR